jgi:hypothetical protein
VEEPEGIPQTLPESVPLILRIEEVEAPHQQASPMRSERRTEKRRKVIDVDQAVLLTKF